MKYPVAPVSAMASCLDICITDVEYAVSVCLLVLLFMMIVLLSSSSLLLFILSFTFILLFH